MDTSRSFTDQMGNRIGIRFPPKRIVSLVPSQTELLADLGLEKEVLGITKYCIHPVGWQSTKTITGGTKNFDPDLIGMLKPDLIVGNKEENYKKGIDLLSASWPVWMSDISNLEQALAMVTSVGELTGREQQAKLIVRNILKSFSTITRFPPVSVLYLIWRKPWMAAGPGTFINSMIDTIGLKNAITSVRYPQLSSADIQMCDPEYIFLSSEPYPFSEKHIAEIQGLCPSSKIRLVDGEMFSWYGSRLIKAPDYFRSITIS